MKLMYFTFVKQQLSRAFGLMIVAVAVAKLGYVGIDKPNLVIAYLGIAFGN